MPRPAAVPQLIVVFGAAVRADGAPSPALVRRIGYAAAAARLWPDAVILCSGATTGERPSEARVMSQALAEMGVAAERLILDEASRDTLQSVAFASRLMGRGGWKLCVACSDGYHLPRIRMTFAALGYAAIAGPTAPGRGGAGRFGWWRMQAREMVALPYDVALARIQRRALLAN